MIHLIDANISNLLSCWKEVAKYYNGYVQEEGLEYTFLNFSQQPNKLLLQEEITDKAIDRAKCLIEDHNQNVQIPYFNINAQNKDLIVLNNALKKSLISNCNGIKSGATLRYTSIYSFQRSE